MAESDSGEKSESPSQKRRDDARKDGQVAYSKELSSAALLGSFLLLFYFTGSTMVKALADLLADSFRNLQWAELDIPLIKQLLMRFLQPAGIIVFPFFGTVVIIGVFSSVVQVGVNITFKPLTPKLEKMSPFKGLGRIFSKQSLVELVKSLFKMGVIGYIGYYTFMESLEEIHNLISVDPKSLFAVAGEIIGRFTLRLFIALLTMAVFDYMFQIWDLEQKLKMTKQEVKDEYKQSEGDPALKGKIRQIQQQMSQGRMMQEVPESDVVISNPTHFAIAMKYDRETMHAPQIMAKGVDHIALRMIEIAKENDVLVYQNPAVARAIYFQVEIGEGVPEEFYKAIAEILAFVYKAKKKKK
ncbi:MAG: flagellar biosynthesis protein FlhB [SAR324 cluster bacterium]|uniref:Flagellar biosynthetic protein FlhB n=1 Tax=SAR324 cluster bacterium TaxID=2024889 RepID=A0A2A4SQX3_9DELT|nr:MAG: flagellar biosynthesis protein FlhB [SAR324 cluster bacterium]